MYASSGWKEYMPSGGVTAFALFVFGTRFLRFETAVCRGAWDRRSMEASSSGER